MPNLLRRRMSSPRSSGPPQLLRVGPYAGKSSVFISSLTNLTISSNTTVGITPTFDSPYTYNTLTVNNDLRVNPADLYTAWYIWVNSLVVGASGRIMAFGADGSDGGAAPPAEGNGGNGSSGGGAGSAFEAEAGNGGSFGEDGQSIDYQGGSGTANVNGKYLSGVPTTWFGKGGSGGAGEIAPSAYYAGAGGTEDFGLAGGGGGGSEDLDNQGLASGGGGGGGGGLICIVGKSLSGTGILYAPGGNGGQGSQKVYQFGFGGGGGGGVISLFFQKYTGGINANVSPGDSSGATSPVAGTARIYEIGRNGTTLTLRAFNQSWDNT